MKIIKFLAGVCLFASCTVVHLPSKPSYYTSEFGVKNVRSSRLDSTKNLYTLENTGYKKIIPFVETGRYSLLQDTSGYKKGDILKLVLVKQDSVTTDSCPCKSGVNRLVDIADGPRDVIATYDPWLSSKTKFLNLDSMRRLYGENGEKPKVNQKTIFDSLAEIVQRIRSMGYKIHIDIENITPVETPVFQPNYFTMVDYRLPNTKSRSWASTVLIPKFTGGEGRIYVAEVLRTVCGVIKNVIPIYDPWPYSKRSSMASFELLYNDGIQSHGLNFWKADLIPWAENTYHGLDAGERIFNSAEVMFAMDFGQKNPDMPKGTKLRVGLNTFIIHGVIQTVLLSVFRK